MDRARSGRDMGGSEVWGRGGVVRWRWGCGGGGSSEGGGEGVGRSSHHSALACSWPRAMRFATAKWVMDM